MQNQKTITLILKITQMYRDTPKPDGWFGAHCTVKRKNKGFFAGQDIPIAGKATSFRPEQGIYVKAVVSVKENKKGSHDIHAITPYTGTRDALAALITNHSLFEGLPRGTADKLWDQFGRETVSTAITGWESLGPGWGKHDAKLISKGFTELFLEDAIKELMPAITPKLAKQLSAFYKAHTVPPEDDSPGSYIYIPDPVAHLKENPYNPMQELKPSSGLFKACDSLAGPMGFQTNDPRRLSAAAILCMRELLESTGSTYLDMMDDKPLSDKALLAKQLYALLYMQNGYLQDLPAAQYMRFPLVRDSIQIAENACQMPGRLYDNALLRKEQKIAAAIAELLEKQPIIKPSDPLIDSCIQDWSEMSGKSLSDEQIQAVHGALTNRMSVITGGPGRGKTEVTSCICFVWQALSGTYEGMAYTPNLTAPTGMAAKNMGRFLEKDSPMAPRTIMYRQVTEPSLNGLCILDEVSMVSLDWMELYMDMCKNEAMRHIKDSIHLVFIGDPDQLPSIGAGRILKDLLDIPEIPVFRLTKCFRTNIPDILFNANTVITGNTSVPLARTENFRITDSAGGYPVTDKGAADAIVEEYVSHASQFPLNTIALLCPVKKGSYENGAGMLNKRIQDRLNPIHKTAAIPKLYSGDGDAKTQVRIGDRVVFSKNLIALGLVNGDCGTIIEVCDKYKDRNGKWVDKRAVVFKRDTPLNEKQESTRTVRIPEDYWKHLELAYALTVHKSQGSEYPHVIISLPQAAGNGWLPPGFLSRNLLYTAITRAKQSVHLTASMRSLQAAIMTPPCRRNSSLPEWVEKNLHKENNG